MRRIQELKSLPTMTKATKGVLLLNLGTPDSPSTSDVRKYLREFLMDKRVIDIPFIGRWLLVNLIIAPFRGPKSAEEYKKVWTKNGSPLKHYGLELEKLVQEELGENYFVKTAMRYQNPSMPSILKEFEHKNFEEIIILPLYPQYAGATTGSTIEEVNRIMSTWENIPSTRTISQFYDNKDVIHSFAENAKQWTEKHNYDHYLFSYHGLPERQIEKASCNNYCQLDKCCNKIGPNNQYCYRAQCFATTRAIVKELGIKEEEYTVCFQSRLGKAEWIKPYAEDTLKKLAKEGKKNILAFSPAFVADCLETTIEVGEMYKEEFIELGGTRWDLVKSLNTEPLWVKSVAGMVKGE